MEFSLFHGGNDGDDNGVGLLEIANTFLSLEHNHLTGYNYHMQPALENITVMFVDRTSICRQHRRDLIVDFAMLKIGWISKCAIEFNKQSIAKEA